MDIQSVSIRNSFFVCLSIYNIWKFEALPAFAQLLFEIAGNPIKSDSIASVLLPRLTGYLNWLTDHPYTIWDK